MIFPRGFSNQSAKSIATLLWIAVAVMISGCVSQPEIETDSELEFYGVQTKSVKDVTVSVGILTDEQSRNYFGLDFGKANLQVVWISVRNASPFKLWFMRNALDPDFYSPDEVTLIMKDQISGKALPAVRQKLRDQSLRVLMKSGMITEGFVYLPKVLGGRYVDIRLAQDSFSIERARRQEGNQALEHEYLELRFGFAIPLPDGTFDYELLDTQHTYGDRELPDLSEAEFRSRLESLPCCALDEEETAEGDPLNLVIVGNSVDVLNTLSRAGWSFTQRITLESIKRLLGAVISGNNYPVAPVSNMYLFGRKQDFALQRARLNIAQRNHLRLWLAPFQYLGKQVWVGQVSRDIGIKLTPKSPSFTTHIVDPEVDLTREYLLHSLLAQGFVKRFGFVKGSRQASRDNPATNLTDDPYFSDGMRLVVVLSPDPVSYRDVHNFLWEQSAAPVSEGQSDSAWRNVRPIKTAIQPAAEEIP